MVLRIHYSLNMIIKSKGNSVDSLCNSYCTKLHKEYPKFLKEIIKLYLAFKHIIIKILQYLTTEPSKLSIRVIFRNKM